MCRCDSISGTCHASLTLSAVHEIFYVGLVIAAAAACSKLYNIWKSPIKLFSVDIYHDKWPKYKLMDLRLIDAKFTTGRLLVGRSDAACCRAHQPKLIFRNHSHFILNRLWYIECFEFLKLNNHGFFRFIITCPKRWRDHYLCRASLKNIEMEQKVFCGILIALCGAFLGPEPRHWPCCHTDRRQPSPGLGGDARRRIQCNIFEEVFLVEELLKNWSKQQTTILWHWISFVL